MPAPKSGSSPDDSESNMNISEEDGEDLPSKTSPATHKLTLKRGHVRETTAPPRTKKKLSDSVEGGNIFDRSSSSPPKDSTSDPPVKKAKLLNASSASCGEALSQKVNAKVSLKRAASTDSEDEMSSDGSKTDIFKERDDGDKARCVRQYSNRVKAKRKAEELPSTPQERSQDSSAAPTVTVQMDHDYGRASDTVSTQNLNDGNSDIQEKNNQFVNQESLVHSTQSESNEILTSAEESLKTDSQFQCTSVKAEYNPNSLVNDASHREGSNCAAVPEDCITSAAVVNEHKNVVQSVISQKDSGDVSQVLLSATLNSSTAEANPGCQEEPQAGERAASGQSSMCSETATKHSDSQPVETTASSDGPLETRMDRSVREDPKSESLQHCVSHDVPDTTTGSFDGDHKIVCDPGEGERKEVGSHSAPTLAVPGTALDVMVRSTDSTTEDAEAVGEQHQTEMDSASEPKIDTDRQPDSAQKEDLQIDESYECSGHPGEVTEETDHERASTPGTQIKMDAKPSGQDLSNGAALEESEITTDSNEHSEINSTVEHQDNMNLDNSSGPKSPVTAGTESFDSDCTAEAQNQDRKDTEEPERDVSAGDHDMVPEHSEKTTEATPESSSPDASEHAVDGCDEVQNLPVVCQSKQDGGPEVPSEDTSNAAATYEAQELTQAAADISERVEHPPKVQPLEDHGSDSLVPTESASPTTTQRDIDFQTTAASEEICTPTEATEVAVRKELTAATHECEEDKDTKMAECESAAGIQQEDQVEAAPEAVAGIQSYKNAGINVWYQEKDVDGDATTDDCAVIQMETTSAPAGDLQSCQNLVANDLNGAGGGKEVTSECCDGEKEEVKHPQLQTDMEPSATAGEISVASSTAEVDRPQGPGVTNPDTEVQENPVTEALETRYTSVDTADSLGNIGSAAEEEMTSYQRSRVEAQRSDNLEISDLSTDVQQDLVSEGEGSKRDEDKMTREERDSVAQMLMEAAAEEVSDSPCVEAQNHKGRKIREGDSGVYQDVGREGDEDTPVTECADISEVTMPNPEELSSQTVLMQSCQSVEVSEVHGEEEKVSESCGAKVDEDVLAAASISVPEPQMSTEDSERAEEIPTTVNGEDLRSLEPHELAASLQNNEVDGQNTTDRIHVPEAQTTMETSAPPEETPSPSPTEDQSCGHVEMLELDKGVKEDGVEHKVTENLSVTECVTHPDSQMNIEASRVPVEVPSPPPTVEIQSREKVEIMGHSSEVKETTDNVRMESNSTSIEPLRSDEEPGRPSKEFEPDLLTATCESKVDGDAFAAERVSVPEPQKMETTAATEGISRRPPTLDTGEVCELGTDVPNDVASASLESKVDEDSGPAGSVDIPEAPVETTATQEHISNVASAVEQDCQEAAGDPPHASVCDINEPPTVAASENNEDTGSGDENVQVDAICGSGEGLGSALDEEAKMQVTQADGEPAVVSTEQPDAGRKGGSEQREVTLLVFASGEAVPPLEEQVEMIAQPEEELQAIQVVYEPISSPESSDDRDVPAASQNHVGFSVLGMEETVQQTEGGPSADGNITAVNNTEQQSQVPDSQEEEMRGESPDVPDSCASVGAEQSGKVKQVAVISSSDDIRMPEGQVDGAVEGSENRYADRSSAAESSEVVHEVAGLPEGAVLTVAETTATTMFAIPDSTSEEYVILEPVPQSEINFDIVTQAAAESGLSVPFAAEANAGVAQGDVMNGPRVMVLSEAEAPRSQAPDATEALNQKIISPAESDVQNSDPHQPPSAHTLDLDTSEVDAHKTSQDCPSVTVDTNEVNLGIQEVQILEDMEIGREVVLAEEDNEEDGDVSIIGKTQKKAEPAPPEVKLDEENKNEDSSGSKLKQNTTAEKVGGEKREPEEVKPKKQQMNTQARTKARLAALAEQKAAAAKKSANRHQLNLLALCQEIAEDIETDSMLLKKIEEEKQAAAAAAAAAAADVASKHEASEESPHANAQANADTAPASAPAGPEAPPAPADEVSPTQPPAADATEAKPADEPPKRRFFISQVSVPLKAHEKKKLTRYQRLRQVELQREKMSWARVKKLKSDQANQMFSDIDWQEPLNAFSQFSMNPVAKAPPPVPGPAKTPPPSVASTSKSETPTKDVSKADPPKDEPVKTEPIKPEPVKTEPIRTEATEAEPTKTEPAKSEEAKSNLAKPEAAKSSPLNAEVRRSTRQTKAQASKETPAPGPSPKVTRSAAKKKLPAVPPPMPNGLNAQKQSPVEYKPYKPKPKYSFEDFELDDDPVPVAPAKASPRPQQARPNLQQVPTAQSKPGLPAQPPSQTLLKTRTAPAGQDSAPSMSAVATKPPANAPAAAAGSSNAAPSAKPPLKPSALSPPPSKASSAPAQPGGEAAQSGRSTSATSSTCAAAGPPPEKTVTPPSAERSKDATSSPSSAPPSRVSPEGKLEMPDASKRCEEKPSADGAAPLKNAPAEKMESKTHDGRTPLSEASLQKELKKHREADKDGTQTIIDAGQKHFGAVGCTVCGMLYSAANPEDESQHLLFHNQFISAVKYVGWKKERILAEYPDGKIILVLPDDPKYSLKKVEEIREVVDSDLGFQQVETKCPSKTKTFLFISSDKKVAGCLIAEHIEEGYRVIEDPVPEGSEGEKLMFERQRAWCCSITPEPAICGISRIWVVSMMRRQGIASRMLDCLRNNFVFGSYLSKDEIAFSDPTPDGKLFATKYFGTSQFLVYNFVSGTSSSQPKAGTL
ncbi:N-acetyltransferase ESCO1 [Takifugu flavidus]|uniref:N-acetyltransferase ESCO1 n=1 Tax=Takifugu flavidus TaxID=433684 RepID=A0A5C6NTM9_9TELE|nr:N-acetyltransferase ESCO1 [Takifugu flavidus]